MAVAARRQQFGRSNGLVFDHIDLKDGRHAEMLKNIVVFKRNCNLHV